MTEANDVQRNLVKNGGVLDSVIFLERTNNKEDLLFLDKLIKSEPAYERRKLDLGAENNKGFSGAWDGLEDDVMYVKMDDDVVYMADDAITAMVCTKVAHPEYFLVSANVVNQPMISWIHHNLGAIKPYLPEVKREYPKLPPKSDFDWRASKLPSWEGPSKFSANDWVSPEHKKHRWLPLRDQSDHILDKTPIVITEYDAFGKGLHKWQIAAQEHYSFFEHLEDGDLWQYKFNIWDFQYKRVGIQFIAIMGHDVNAAKPIPGDDEQHLGVTAPQRFGRRKCTISQLGKKLLTLPQILLPTAAPLSHTIPLGHSHTTTDSGRRISWRDIGPTPKKRLATSQCCGRHHHHHQLPRLEPRFRPVGAIRSLACLAIEKPRTTSGEKGAYGILFFLF